MGMVANLISVSSEELREMTENSSLLETKIYSEDEVEQKNLIDLDKSWAAIFYLLTGHTLETIEEAQPPFSWVLVSGQLIDEEQDLGYGPAHYITADQVKELNDALKQITTEELKKRYDGNKMNKAEIYPGIWTESDAFDYVKDYFVELKKFYQAAANEDKAVITFIN